MKSRSFTANTFSTELTSILNWWSIHSVDHDLGGFIGRIDGSNNKHLNAPKAAILNTRILWSFSAAANEGYSDHIEVCHRAYEYIVDHFMDSENGGIYWMLNAQGQPIDRKKQVYAQAFCIYAFTEYYMLTKDKRVLDQALDLFQLLESNSRDHELGGYFEAFSNDWQKLDNVRLSEKEGNDTKTMNTHLHILEAYTNLYRACTTEKVRGALEDLVDLYLKRFIDPKTGRLKLFFDEHWNENLTHHSPGHEIESCWLLNEASHVLADQTRRQRTQEIGIVVAKKVLNHGVDNNGSIINEILLDGGYDDQRDWWPQAEGVIGFYDAYDLSKEKVFLEAAQKCWSFIDKNIIDHTNGEWYWAAASGGTPITSENKLGPWKAPYHNTRMCLEMIKRLEE